MPTEEKRTLMSGLDGMENSSEAVEQSWSLGGMEVNSLPEEGVTSEPESARKKLSVGAEIVMRGVVEESGGDRETSLSSTQGGLGGMGVDSPP
jgi:hypothetical protein